MACAGRSLGRRRRRFREIRWLGLGGGGGGASADEAGQEGGGGGGLGGEGGRIGGGEAEPLLEAAGALALAVELVVVRRRLRFLHRSRLRCGRPDVYAKEDGDRKPYYLICCAHTHKGDIQ